MPKDSWKPAAPFDPAFHILWLLGATVGLPYFLLSSTSPLLQAWYAQKDADAAPYRFYAVSNTGSMLASVSYPVLVEPWVGHFASSGGMVMGIRCRRSAVCGGRAFFSPQRSDR